MYLPDTATLLFFCSRVILIYTLTTSVAFKRARRQQHSEKSTCTKKKPANCVRRPH